MKRTLIVVALLCLTAVGISSCATQTGCKGTQGYIGYGSRH